MMLRFDCNDRKCNAMLMSRSWQLNCSTIPSTPTFTTAEFRFVDVASAAGAAAASAAAGAATAVVPSAAGAVAGASATAGVVVGVLSALVAPGTAAAATAASIAASFPWLPESAAIARPSQTH